MSTLMSTLGAWLAVLERFPIDTARLNALQQVVRSPLSKRRVQRHRL